MIKTMFGSSASTLQEIVCCMGQPVAGNPMQYIMEKAFAAADLDWRYLTLEIAPDDLPVAIAGMKAMGFRGANVTAPHQVAVLEHLDGLSDEANIMGAVNCIYREEGRLIGENTDGKGFVQSLQGIVDPQGKQIAVLGAGGAARAIAVELALAGADKFTIVNRDDVRGRQLVRMLTEKVKASAKYVPLNAEFSVPEEIDILIHATSIGLGNGSACVPVRIASLRPTTVAADVIVHSMPTRFLREAAERGCQTVNGLGMLVNQTAITFRTWTGVEPNIALMQEALEEFLEW